LKSQIFVLLSLVGLAGCASPEDGRPRGGGAGADGGNYPSKPIAAPSKLDGTRALPVGAAP
jgi:hypothetical protein